MADVTKHRLETIHVGISFADLLPAGVLLTGDPTVVITRGSDADGWTDVTAEFPNLDEALDGTAKIVELTLAPPAEVGHQAKGDSYRIRAACATDADPPEVPVAMRKSGAKWRTITMEIVIDGGPDAT